jgi:hypothetical protein
VGVIGQRFDASGNKLGGEFVVNETTAGSQYQPEITALSTGGFVVTFYNDNYDISGAGTTSDVYIREYDASGNPIDGQRKLESPTTAPPTARRHRPGRRQLRGRLQRLRHQRQRRQQHLRDPPAALRRRRRPGPLGRPSWATSPAPSPLSRTT